MAKKGGLSHKSYRETRGIKVTGGQTVTIGSILTRQGDRWKAGVNVGGISSLYALVNGQVYFTKRKSRYIKSKSVTVVNVKQK